MKKLHRQSRLALLVLCALIAGAYAATGSPASDDVPAFRPNDRILFQGDSITDGNRGRNEDPNHILGHGYVFAIASKYGWEYPERHLTFINRGVGGNKLSDLKNRWQADTLDLKPDLLSIMIGVNDLNGGVSAEEYARQYDELLAGTIKALPKTRIVLAEPFGLPVGAKKDNWDAYKIELSKRQAVVSSLGAKYRLPVVHCQRAFDQACRRAPADYWIWDGIHPTYSGHQVLANEWVRTVNEFWGATTQR